MVRFALVLAVALQLAAVASAAGRPRPTSRRRHAQRPWTATWSRARPGSSRSTSPPTTSPGCGSRSSTSTASGSKLYEIGEGKQPPPSTTVPCDEEPFEELAEMRAEKERDERAALRPAPGSEPRVVVRARLDDAATWSLVVWRNGDGALCAVSLVEGGDDAGAIGGPLGPCAADERCNDICLDESGSGDVDDVRWRLEGTASDALRDCMFGDEAEVD